MSGLILLPSFKKILKNLTKRTPDALAIIKDTAPKPIKRRMNLSKMTDQELKQSINRELLERQYNDLFGKTENAEISKGRKYVRDILNAAGTVLAIGSSALSIALAIKELKG